MLLDQADRLPRLVSAFCMRTMFSTGEERTNGTSALGAGSQSSVWDKWLVAEGVPEPEECLGFALSRAASLALPEIPPLAFLTRVT